MSKIIRLDIENYRGIEKLNLSFDRARNLVCLIGRGDSGKSTVLEAISSVLSPSWNLNFFDTDFFNSDHSKDIEISATLVDFPENLLSEKKYGCYVRGLDTRSDEITDSATSEEMGDSLVPALTIKLTVDSSLEPKWVITNTREQEDRKINATDRALLNCYLISDYVDRHFSWNKGNPLYALLKSTKLDKGTDDSNIVIQYLREAKEEIDKNQFEDLLDATTLIKAQAAELGLDISRASTTLDSRELSIKDGRISLHEESVPFRQKGKGTKRLASIAIQSALVRNGGIMLIDEVEQGLEPDRVRHAVRSLQEHHAGQIFITTHSRDTITELGSDPLILLLRDIETHEIRARSLGIDQDELQKVIRACPEAFFAKKVIVCEGATEIGICRALDKWRKRESKEQMSFKDCAYVDGSGSNMAQRVDEIHGTGIKTALFCDSDLTDINEKKLGWTGAGVPIFDCDEGLCIEQQVFKDLPWAGIKELLMYIVTTNRASFVTVLSNFNPDSSAEWKDGVEVRQQFQSVFESKKGSCRRDWFKAVHHGEALGDIVIRRVEEMEEGSRLKEILKNISGWVDL